MKKKLNCHFLSNPGKWFKAYWLMRNFIILFFVFNLSAFSNGLSQEVSSVKYEDATLTEVFENLKEQTGYGILYKQSEVDLDIHVNMTKENSSVQEILNEALEGTNLTYKVQNEVIVVYKETKKLQVNIESTQQEKKVISGTVIDESGVPLPGVSIFVMGTTIGVTTSIDGTYTIQFPDSGKTLVFSFIGMKTQELAVGDKTEIDITLIQDNQGLDEVVVVGYGTQTKANLTGSVATVNAKQLASRPVQSISGALAGTMAGVSVVQSSGEPGSQNGSITIRGKNSINGGSPLVIVDGIPGSMNTIDMNDVENISVLKDAASAAIYGVSAANGVILITTKLGKKNQKAQLSYNSYYSWTQPTNTPSYLGSYDYATLYNEGYKNDNPDSDIIPFSTDDLQKYKDGSAPYTHPNSDWFGEVLNKRAFEQNHHLQVSGGSKSTTYNASFGFLDQGALIDNINYKRYNVRANVQSDITDKLSVGMNLYGHQEYKNANWDSAAGIYGYLTRTPPTNPIYNPDGTPSYNSSLKNAAAHIGNDGYRKNNYTEGKVILNAQYKPFKGMSVKGVYSSRFNYSHSEGFKKKLVYSNAEGTQTFDSGQREMYENNSRQQRNTYQLIADYDANITENHHIHLLGGFEQYEYKNNWVDASRKGFSSDGLNELDNGDGENQFNKGNGEDYGRRSYFGRLNYDFKGKYLFEANMRYDGTSWFSEDVRWGLFPAMSFAWRMSEEDFMKEIDWLDNLKLRGGWGSTGNNELQSYRKNDHYFGKYYEHVATYGVGGAYILGDKYVQGAWEGKFPNSALSWATVSSYELAVEASAFNGLIGMELACYKKVTTDMILNLPVPSALGLGAPPQNAGELKNTGIDLMLTHRNKIGELSYDVNLNFSYVKNEITDLKNSDYQDGKYWVGAGSAYGSFYGYESEGLFNSSEEITDHATQAGNIAPGDIKYKDQLTVDTDGDGNADAVDGKINGDDRVVIGKNSPSYSVGLNLNANYRNWDFSVFFQGAFDVDVYFENEAAYAFFNGGKVLERHMDRWTPDNMDASYPRATMSQQHNFKTSDYWLKDGSYVRLKNIQIGYNLPESVLEKIGISKARVYFSGENLLTFTGIDDFDPEAPSVNRGAFYGNVKKVSVGLNVNF